MPLGPPTGDASAPEWRDPTSGPQGGPQEGRIRRAMDAVASKFRQTPPVGSMILTAADTPDDGYLFCHGQSLVRASYADLFNRIGTTHGTVDSTHFNIPDMRDVFPLMVTGGSLTDVGGATEVTLTAPQSGLPDHVHEVDSNLDTDTANNNEHSPADWGNGSSDHYATSGVTGGAQDAAEAHTNMPPWQHFNWQIRT
jgi:microcystin-dependent protein